MYKEFRFLPTIQFSLMIKRLKEVIRNKKKALFYIGGSDVLPPPLARDEETKLLKEYAGGSQEAQRLAELKSGGQEHIDRTKPETRRIYLQKI